MRDCLMKRRIVIVLIIAAVAAGWLWRWLTPAAPPGSQAAAAILPKPKAAAPPMATMQATAPRVAAPALPPAPAPTAIATARAVTTSVSDDNKNIQSQISGLLAQIQSGDLKDVIENFASPDELETIDPNTKAMFEEQMQNLQGSAQIQIWIEVLQSMKDSTPTYDNANGTATFVVSDPTGAGREVRPVVLKKIDGKWYFSVTGLLIGGAGFLLLQPPPPGGN